MAVTSAFLFTNTTASTGKSVSLFNMGETTNYGVKNSDSKTRLINTTGTNLGVNSEAIEYKASIQPKVDVKIPVPNPAKGIKAVQYSSSIETILRSTDTDFIQDDPIYMQLTIRHPQSAYISETHLATVLGRLISSLQHTDGDWRFNELANLATQPSAN